MYAIYGSSQDSIGMLIGGHYTRNTGYILSSPFSAMAFLDTNQNMIGQIIFDDYTGANIEIHAYGPGMFTKKNITLLYDYVFNKLKCARLTAKPLCTDEKLSHLLKRIGFVYECTHEKYYKEGEELIDAVVYKLTRETVPKWVKINAQT